MNIIDKNEKFFWENGTKNFQNKNTAKTRKKTQNFTTKLNLLARKTFLNKFTKNLDVILRL